MFQPHCNSVATIREKVACLHLGQSSPVQETCMVVTVTIRTRNPKGEIRLKGQKRVLRFPNYLPVVNLGSEFAFLKDNKRLTYALVAFTSYLFVLSCCVSHLAQSLFEKWLPGPLSENSLDSTEAKTSAQELRF